jgi:hypothetical protein
MFVLSFDPGVVFMGLAILCLTSLRLDLSMINFHNYRINDGRKEKKKRMSETEMCHCVLAFVNDYTALFQHTKTVLIEQQKISARSVKDVAMLLFQTISAKFSHIQVIFIDPMSTRRFYSITVHKKDHPGKSKKQIYDVRKALTEVVFRFLCDTFDMSRVVRCLTINKNGKGFVMMKDPLDATIQLGYYYLNRHLFPHVKYPAISVKETATVIRAVKMKFLDPDYNHAKMVAKWSNKAFKDTAASIKKLKELGKIETTKPEAIVRTKVTSETGGTTTTSASRAPKKPRVSTSDDVDCISISSGSSTSAMTVDSDSSQDSDDNSVTSESDQEESVFDVSSDEEDTDERKISETILI